jgi:hypothetical protein
VQPALAQKLLTKSLKLPLRQKSQYAVAQPPRRPRAVKLLPLPRRPAKSRLPSQLPSVLHAATDHLAVSVKTAATAQSVATAQSAESARNAARVRTVQSVPSVQTVTTIVAVAATVADVSVTVTVVAAAMVRTSQSQRSLRMTS